MPSSDRSFYKLTEYDLDTIIDEMNQDAREDGRDGDIELTEELFQYVKAHFDLDEWADQVKECINDFMAAKRAVIIIEVKGGVATVVQNNNHEHILIVDRDNQAHK